MFVNLGSSPNIFVVFVLNIFKTLNEKRIKEKRRKILF
jgi:hypothetical protein